MRPECRWRWPDLLGATGPFRTGAMTMLGRTRLQRQRRARLTQATMAGLLAILVLTPKDLSALGAVLAPLSPVTTAHAGETAAR